MLEPEPWTRTPTQAKHFLGQAVKLGQHTLEELRSTPPRYSPLQLHLQPEQDDPPGRRLLPTWQRGCSSPPSWVAAAACQLADQVACLGELERRLVQLPDAEDHLMQALGLRWVCPGCGV